MKTSFRALAFVVALATLAKMPARAVETGDPLERLKTAFSLKTNDAERAFAAAQQRADAGYAKDLQTMHRQMTAKNDEFGIRPLELETKRYQRDHTVLRAMPEGTPELLTQAHDRYFALFDAATATHSNQLQLLRRSYMHELGLLRTQAGASTELIARVDAELRSAGPANTLPPACQPPLSLPTNLAKGLRIAYAFAGNDTARVADLSGRGRDGSISGTFRLEAAHEGFVREFARDADQVGFAEQKLGRIWTFAARVQFPLERAGQPRTLLSGGFRQHHVMVDERGRLGDQANDFVSSGYDTSALKGWHELIAVADGASTTFFVDDKAVGRTRTVCAEPMKAIGNSASGGGQPWGGLIGYAVLWSEALSPQLITEFQHRRTEPAKP